MDNLILNAKILIVDDAFSVRGLLEMVLQKAGFNNLYLTHCGLEALKLLQNGLNCDLIITDDRMPNFDGYQLIETIKNEDKFSHIPIIMIGSNDVYKQENLTIKQSLINNFRYLHKPLNLDNFLTKVKEILAANHGININNNFGKLMSNISDNRIKILLDLGLEKEANQLMEINDLKKRDNFLYALIIKYLQSSDFHTSLTLGKTIRNKDLKEFILHLIFKVYIRQYLSNNINQEIDSNLLQRIKKNIKRINEKSLPKFNQRIKVINLTLGAEINEVRETIERIAKRDLYLVVTTLIDIFNLGKKGFRVLLDILIHSENNELKQICYHLFKHQGGSKTREKIKPYKPDTTIIIINKDENYTFKKVKENEKITYQRIEEWEKYHLPDFIIPQVKIVNHETFRQLFLPYTFIVFAQPNQFLLTQIKKDIYLNKIPIIYPHIEGQNLPENLTDNLVKLYQPSVNFLEKVSGKTIAQMKENNSISPSEIEAKIAETEHNISLFIENMLAQI